MTSYVTFGLSLIVFFFFHSLFANAAIKKKLHKSIVPHRYYRVFYNLISLLLVVPVAYIYVASNKQFLFQPTTAVKTLGLLFIASGIYLWKKSFTNYSLAEFTGLDRFSQKQEEKQKFISTGLNELVRHPLYSIGYLVLSGVFLIQPHPFVIEFVILMSLYLPIGIYYEEKKLTEEFGDKYVSYKKKTPAIFPDVARMFKR